MTRPGKAMAELPRERLLVYAGVQTVFFVGLGLGLWTFAGRPLAGFIVLEGKQIMLGLAIALGMIALGYVLFRGFPKFGEKLIRDQAQQFAFLQNRLDAGAIIFIAACAGIGEEALFRGGVLVLIDHYAPFTLALVASAGLFTIVHFARPAVAMLIFAIGIFFGLVFWASASLLAVMIAHWVYDIWALWFIQNEMHRLGVFAENAVPEDMTIGENQ